jgi:hypothetical protein
VAVVLRQSPHKTPLGDRWGFLFPAKAGLPKPIETAFMLGIMLGMIG